ncbi:threonylcarbamoyl-AMP synthase [Candidatus Peregrinibacteria bacterium]|nr:threonylcarbamoyl-AMP synthase [Candidatus Peregrinibacteria bacterium]
MEIIKVREQSFDAQFFRSALGELQNGGVIMHPTDTCYGLAVDIFNKKGLEKLYKMKEMSKTKPVTIIVDSLEMAQKYAFFGKKALALAKSFWPGAFTFVLPPHLDIFPNFFTFGFSSFQKNFRTIAIRMPHSEFSLQLIRFFGRPITSTSANLSGQSSCYSVTDFQDQMKGRIILPDLIFDAGRLPYNLSSQIIEIYKNKTHILR